MQSNSFWAALGLSLTDELVYRAVLEGGESVTSARGTTVLKTEWDEAIDRLVSLRLLRSSKGNVEAVEPRLALTSLARRRQAILDQASIVADDLSPLVTAARLDRDPSQFFSVLRGGDEIVAQIVYLLDGARFEVFGTDAPPYVSDLNIDIHDAQLRLLGRGTRFHTLYDSSALQDPRHVEQMKTLAIAGEIARVVPRMHVKLLIVDRETVLLPLAHSSANPEPTALVVGGPAIVDALLTLFNLLWQSAVDPGLATLPKLTADRLEKSDRKEGLLHLLAVGMPDKTICSTLGVSERTLRRMILELQESFKVETRFQLGAAFARRTTKSLNS